MRRLAREIGTKAGAVLLALLSFKLSTTLDSCAIAGDRFRSRKPTTGTCRLKMGVIELVAFSVAH